ncbi:hypothetical protein HYPSUDRAFT_200732 [Hypholoma sublateritium FD-334 SS-4]|uniref:Uncharacterized protein n=1 Tax=Hypholoma sublateritium (strain FD-334 SS-4) TaxID=945553 RepID=A0A0D2P6H8_HYPSF|nr:hypothetical protein HYPSUDRAFT_200732 [Hypholoma sublateritium FD-334 SS-4]
MNALSRLNEVADAPTLRGGAAFRGVRPRECSADTAPGLQRRAMYRAYSVHAPWTRLASPLAPDTTSAPPRDAPRRQAQPIGALYCARQPRTRHAITPERETQLNKFELSRHLSPRRTPAAAPGWRVAGLGAWGSAPVAHPLRELRGTGRLLRFRRRVEAEGRRGREYKGSATRRGGCDREQGQGSVPPARAGAVDARQAHSAMRAVIASSDALRWTRECCPVANADKKADKSSGGNLVCGLEIVADRDGGASSRGGALLHVHMQIIDDEGARAGRASCAFASSFHHDSMHNGIRASAHHRRLDARRANLHGPSARAGGSNAHPVKLTDALPNPRLFLSASCLTGRAQAHPRVRASGIGVRFGARELHTTMCSAARAPGHPNNYLIMRCWLDSESARSGQAMRRLADISASGDGDLPSGKTLGTGRSRPAASGRQRGSGRSCARGSGKSIRRTPKTASEAPRWNLGCARPPVELCVVGAWKNDDADALMRALDYRKRAAGPRTAARPACCPLGIRPRSCCQSTMIPGNLFSRIRGTYDTDNATLPTTGPAPPAARAKNGTRSRRRRRTASRAVGWLLPEYTRFLGRTRAYACYSAAQDKHLRRAASTARDTV